jgi:hypothetical protein
MNYDIHIYTDGAAKGNPEKEAMELWRVKWVKPTAKNFTKVLG